MNKIAKIDYFCNISCCYRNEENLKNQKILVGVKIHEKVVWMVLKVCDEDDDGVEDDGQGDDGGVGGDVIGGSKGGNIF